MVHVNLCGRKLTDIVVEGFFEDDAPGRFTPMLSTVYLEFENGLVALRSKKQDYTMEMGVVDEFQPGFIVDPDARYGICSLGSVLMTVYPSDDCSIDRVEVYHPSARGEEQDICALGLLLGTGQYIFFDPMNLSGINIGGPEQRACWLEKLLPETIVNCTIVCRADSGGA